MSRANVANVLTEDPAVSSAASRRAAILFAASDFDASNPELVARQVVHEQFIRAFARHGDPDRHFAVCWTRNDFDRFLGAVRSAAGREVPCYGLTPVDHQGLAEAAVLHVPDASIGHFAWLRRRGRQRGYSLCGVAHGIDSDRVMQHLADMLLAPLQPWDALVCTSSSVRASVEGLCEQWADYLRTRTHATRSVVPVQLPVIPLGVDTALFPDRAASGGLRVQWRQRLGIGADDCVFLVSGGLAHADPQNPPPVCRALQAAASGTARKVHLVHYGRSDAGFKQALAAIHHSVQCHFIEGAAGAGAGSGIWYAADVYTPYAALLPDPFGLTCAEAMAAGLPVVLLEGADRQDTVRHGLEGLIGNDADSCARAYLTLIADGGLRRRLGEGGQKRARGEYDWAHVIRRHLELWTALASVRRSAREVTPLHPGHSASLLRPDPFTFLSALAGPQQAPGHRAA
jgi:glycosyltransferase involved in cell wall biosynthesis